MGRGNIPPFLLHGPVIGFPDNIGNRPQLKRHLVSGAGHLQAVFQNSGNPRAVNMFETLFLTEPGQTVKAFPNPCFVPIRPVIQVRLDLEHLLEAIIIDVEKFIDIGVPRYHEFNLQRHWFGLQGPGGYKPVHLAYIFYLYLFVSNRPFQGLPGQVPFQDIGRL